MKTKPLLAALALAVFPLSVLPAQETVATPASELKALVDQTQAKLRSGKRSATDLAPELAAFDALRAKYRDDKSADAAQIIYLEATLYSQVLEDFDKSKALLEDLKTNYSSTPQGTNAGRLIEQMERTAAAKKAQAALVGQPAPELHFTWSSREGLKSLADLKGKVVVLDFWATWCGPCIASFPQVRELTAHYKDLDVVVLGVTSIQGSVSNLGPSRIDTQGDPKREMALMNDFIKAKDMTWAVAFSEEPVFNPAYGVTGIPHMAIIAPDGIVRHTGLHPAMPHADKVAKIDALLKEFGKPTSVAAAKP